MNFALTTILRTLRDDQFEGGDVGILKYSPCGQHVAMGEKTSGKVQIVPASSRVPIPSFQDTIHAEHAGLQDLLWSEDGLDLVTFGSITQPADDKTVTTANVWRVQRFEE